MVKLYDFLLSGNCYKVRLLLSLLGVEHELVAVDLKSGEHKKPPFLALNAFGQVPVLVDGDVVIRDSQAILVYLARRYGGSDWLPEDAALLGKVSQWLSTASKEIANTVATARLHYLFGASIDVAAIEKQSYTVLKAIDEHLATRQWLECDRPTIADLACFPYIGLAADGKLSLDAYPNIVAWIDRIKQLPGYVGMPGL
ncbi:glutathione S-transferase family protein [Stenomitos frigidus]|uniref:Glutathione S-transferase n=1 Tax=Stenomitos frigidus ULC18 TaxID=2107698 RepID=A0A2T1EI76_9CYAN|nr:glutathione S-transferase family protein [Stenomitos frigidus]PSB32439.1 glutathione S-transferase [Stenomitos frigidus ULC18]